MARVEQIDMKHSPLGTRYRDIEGRRSGIDNRQFSYNCHVPERRLEPDRRINPERRSGLDRRSGLERRALPSPFPDDRGFDKGEG